ncbi:hypothetical protein SGRA_2218 [Saprospira grandis str. Lewin]|uniref:Uncharacterized protein n=1 Tax=Saprospira grandis (strain Lewin) TaxID=984262 RepID=H6L3J9_SAPGL|nr:hypothetical protein SGRA_2218 [Saprospira grandis str. Lewin]
MLFYILGQKYKKKWDSRLSYSSLRLLCKAYFALFFSNRRIFCGD